MKQKSLFSKWMSILLLIAVCYQAAGSYLIYFAWKLYVSEQIEACAAGIPSSKLIQISRTYKGKIDKEFESEGKMYDVIRYEIRNGRINYYCINDGNEEQLNAQLNADNDLALLQKYYSGKAKQAIKKLTEKFLAILTTPVGDGELQKTMLNLKDSFHKKSLTYQRVFTPPPRFF